MTQQQNFHTDDVKSVQNGQELLLVNVVVILFYLLFRNDRQKATKVKCKCDESITKQSIFLEYILL